MLPSEIARRAQVLNHSAVAITDHVDASNIECVGKVINAVKDIKDNWDIEIIPGAEITHAPAEIIDKLAHQAKKFGEMCIRDSFRINLRDYGFFN